MPTSFAELVDTRLLLKKMKGADHPADSSVDAIYISADEAPRFMRALNDAGLERLLAEPEKPVLRILCVSHWEMWGEGATVPPYPTRIHGQLCTDKRQR